MKASKSSRATELLPVLNKQKLLSLTTWVTHRTADEGSLTCYSNRKHWSRSIAHWIDTLQCNHPKPLNMSCKIHLCCAVISNHIVYSGSYLSDAVWLISGSWLSAVTRSFAAQRLESTWKRLFVWFLLYMKVNWVDFNVTLPGSVLLILSSSAPSRVIVCPLK